VTDARRGGRIGVIVPSTNVNLEPHVQILPPRGVTAHFTRVGGYDPDDVADVEEMRAFGELAIHVLPFPRPEHRARYVDELSAAGSARDGGAAGRG
jgi:maleate isomerase